MCYSQILLKCHYLTPGRDSVLAMHGNRDAQGTSGSHLSSAISDAQDKELLTKLHKILQTSDGFDLQEMRTKCKSIDVTQHGLIPKKKVYFVVVTLMLFDQCFIY